MPPGPRSSRQRGGSSDERLRVRRTYERYADSARRKRSWSAQNPGNAAIRRELVGVVFGIAGRELRAAKTILDVGCGSGWWLEQLGGCSDVQAALHGVEILPERLASAQLRAPHAELLLADARELPFADERFDVVTMLTVLSSLGSLADAGQALREAWRVLSADGVLLVWEPRIPNPLNRSTVFIPRAVFRNSLPAHRTEARSTTLLPLLARSLGRATEAVYPGLAKIGLLRTHRLVAARKTVTQP